MANHNTFETTNEPMNNNGDDLQSFQSSVSSMATNHVNDILITRSIAYCQDFYPNAGKTNHHNHSSKSEYIESIRKFFHKQKYRLNIRSLLCGFVPILKWLPNYRWKNDIIPDVISGTTVLALNIPQGLAYGHLAGVGPINGLYVSLFPLLMYAIFGTSHHISIGTFSVISIACKDVIEGIQLENEENDIQGQQQYEPIEILITLCLLVGIIQVYFFYIILIYEFIFNFFSLIAHSRYISIRHPIDYFIGYINIGIYCWQCCSCFYQSNFRFYRY